MVLQADRSGVNEAAWRRWQPCTRVFVSCLVRMLVRTPAILTYDVFYTFLLFRQEISGIILE
jgi:hypothetical protein